MTVPATLTGTIIDAHCHIASLEFTPKSFIDGAVANMALAMRCAGAHVSEKQLSALYEQRMADPNCDELAAEMAEAGIGRSILLAADFTYALKDCALTVEEALLRHSTVQRRHANKFTVFAGVDPRWGRDGVALFERALSELGCSGLKLYPPCGFRADDRMLDPFYELCAVHRVPVLVHIGGTSPALAFDPAHPMTIDEAAQRFPTVDFILAHGAVHYREECVMLCAYRPNIYLDISGYQRGSRHESSEDIIANLVSRGISYKILFGTDWPVFRLQGTQADFVAMVCGSQGGLANAPDQEVAQILSGNINRLLEKRVIMEAAP